MKTTLLLFSTLCLLSSVLRSAPISYAVLTPTGELYKVILAEVRTDAKTHAELKVTPVDPTIPEGMVQDFSQGPKTARGWQLIEGTVRPIVKVAPPPPPAPPPPLSLQLAQIEARLAALEAEIAILKAPAK